jgi:hypothetical protein
MQKPSLHLEEKKRLEALSYFDILDSESEKQFDEILEFIKDDFDVPITLISLVDENRQWFKAKTGLIESETSRDI